MYTLDRGKIVEEVLRALGNHPYVWAFALCLFLNFVFHCSCQQSFTVAMGSFSGGCALTLALYSIARSEKLNPELEDRLNALFIMALGFWLRFYYVLITPMHVRQHDMFYSDRTGHAGYMDYILQNWSVPDVDVRNTWGFYHPPLHHFISAVWIWINEHILLIDNVQARESLQTLSLFYVLVIIITTYKIFRYFKLQGNSLYIPLLFVNFHPAFILLSGSINNDVLSVTLVVCAVYFCLNWYENKSWPNTLKIALCIGLGMMTKLSAAVILPLVVLFILVCLNTTYSQLKHLGLLLFVSLPLGLWYQVKNYLKWDVPLNYVQPISTTSKQYLGTGNFFSRVIDFSSLSNVYVSLSVGQTDGLLSEQNDVNPLLVSLKTSLFDEFINENSLFFGFVNNISVIFFWVNILIVTLAFMAMVYVCYKKCGIPHRLKLFFVGFYFLLMISFYKMAHDYPFVCTMNFRYITPLVIINGLFIGLFLNMFKDDKRLSKSLCNVMGTLSLLFAICSTVVYLSLKLC